MGIQLRPAGHGVRASAPIPARAGIGLRAVHQDLIAAECPDVAWLEVHAENHLGARAADELEVIRRDYPISLHAVGLSLGSAEGLNPAHLRALAEMVRRFEPGLVSDHLSWSAADGLHLPDLLPLPYTHEALDVVADNIARAQDGLQRRLLVENPSAYLRFAGESVSEAEFLAALVRRTGCGVLLDVNNLFVRACNLGQGPFERLIDLLAAVPPEAVGEIHLAGHAVQALEGGGVLRIDDHGSEVCADVWSLYETAIAILGPRPTLIEWDTDVPDLGTLLAEAAAAQARLDARLGGGRHAAAG
jgi:uncharacterized protein (UPF0276 family)